MHLPRPSKSDNNLHNNPQMIAFHAYHSYQSEYEYLATTFVEISVVDTNSDLPIFFGD